MARTNFPSIGTIQGQRADRERGTYFAKQGFASIDINWGGHRWSKVSSRTPIGARSLPSTGPRFYPATLRKDANFNLLPDEHTIDPVVSPRNGNWYLLTYAGRRAITFLEQ